MGYFCREFTYPRAEMTQHIHFAFTNRRFEGGSPSVSTNKEFSECDGVRPKAKSVLHWEGRREVRTQLRAAMLTGSSNPRSNTSTGVKTRDFLYQSHDGKNTEVTFTGGKHNTGEGNQTVVPPRLPTPAE